MNHLCKVLLQLCSQMLQMVGTTPFLWQYILHVFQFCTFSGELNPLLTYAVIFFFLELTVLVIMFPIKTPFQALSQNKNYYFCYTNISMKKQYYVTYNFADINT
jgi:hypothetical protein